MKKSILVLISVFALLCSVQNLHAQSKDFFIGKWNLITTGLPDGDAESVITLTRGEDGKLTGTMVGQNQEKGDTFTKVEEEDESVTCYFTSNGYDCYLFLEKINENKVEGSLLDMFDCVGVRDVNDKAKDK